MSDGFPSMTALLGLLAVAGFQNRDKIGEMLGGLGGGAAPAGRTGSATVPSTGGMSTGGMSTGGMSSGGMSSGGMGAGGAAAGGGLGGLLGGLASSFGGGASAPRDPGAFLNSGLGELVNRFPAERARRDGQFLGRLGAKQSRRAAPARPGHRPGRARYADSADRAVEGRTARPAVARTAQGGGSVHAEWPPTRLIVRPQD